MKEFATQTRIKYVTCIDPLLEGDRLKPGEINNLCCSDDYEAITVFGSMSDKEKDEHIYALYGRVSKHKLDEYMCKWLSFFIIVHKQTLQAKAGRYLKFKKLKLDIWADGVKLGRRADILSVFTLSALISKHTLIHLRNGNIWTTMETLNMDHDDLMKDCDIHLAYLGNGLFSEIKQKMRDDDLLQEGRIHKLADIAMNLKPVISAEPVSTITFKCVQTQNILSGTINIKRDNIGTTTVTAIKGTTIRTGDTGTTSVTDDTPAGTTMNVVNIDPDIEFVGTTLVSTKASDEPSVETKEMVIGSIDSDASTLQLLVSGNARSKFADAACSEIRHGMHSPPPIDRNQHHVHATNSNIVVKDVQINLRRITDLDIDIWMALKPTTYLDDKRPNKPVYMQMLKDDINKSDENTLNPLRMDKQIVKRPRKINNDKNLRIKATVRSGKRPKSAVSSTKLSIKQALAHRHGSNSTPVLSSRMTRMQKIRSGAKSLAFQITVHGLKKF